VGKGGFTVATGWAELCDESTCVFWSKVLSVVMVFGECTVIWKLEVCVSPGEWGE
jgi:hypothetical protein